LCQRLILGFVPGGAGGPLPNQKPSALWSAQQAPATGGGMVVGFYILFAILVGLFAIGRSGGFFLYFMLSIVLTPIVALIILIMATPVVVDTRGAPVKKSWRKRPLSHV
jgi:hypothetical protein